MLLLVLAVIAIYALTLVLVTWVRLSEIFPNRVRGLAMSAGTLALWIACFAGLIFIYRKVPETKGVTLEALEAQLAQLVQCKVELTPTKASVSA